MILGFAVVTATGRLTLGAGAGGVSLTSPSSSSSSELCTSSADLILDEAFAAVLLVVALEVATVAFCFFNGRLSLSLTTASRSLFFLSFASSAARAFFGSFASNRFCKSEPADFATVDLGVPVCPGRGVFAELMGFSSSLASSNGLGMEFGVEPLFVCEDARFSFDKTLPFPRSSLGRSNCHVFSSFPTRVRSYALIALSMAICLSCCVLYPKSQTFKSLYALSVNFH